MSDVAWVRTRPYVVVIFSVSECEDTDLNRCPMEALGPFTWAESEKAMAAYERFAPHRLFLRVPYLDPDLEPIALDTALDLLIDPATPVAPVPNREEPDAPPNDAAV